MVNTRSQKENTTIKKEEEDSKDNLTLNGASNTRNNSKIAKQKPSKSNSRPLSIQPVKVEEDTDTKSLLESASKHSKLLKGQPISQEQINQLIDYMVNDKMSIAKAAREANIAKVTAHYYYTKYKIDPEKKIPLPLSRFTRPTTYSTQEQIENLLKYINEGKMPLNEASAKANMSYSSGCRYYKKYLKDPNQNIPSSRSDQKYTQDQKNEFIGYIVNNKMSINAASRKAKINVATGLRHYRKYFDGQNPAPSHITAKNRCPQEQINELNSYIVDDKMTIKEASLKVNMNYNSGQKYYRQYLKDHNMENLLARPRRQYTQDQIDEFIRFIVDGKLTIKAASKKANITYSTSKRYYKKYLRDQKL